MQSIKQIKNDVDVVLYVLGRIQQIRDDTGFGSIKLDIKSGSVVYSEVAVREHLN